MECGHLFPGSRPATDDADEHLATLVANLLADRNLAEWTGTLEMSGRDLKDAPSATCRKVIAVRGVPALIPSTPVPLAEVPRTPVPPTPLTTPKTPVPPVTVAVAAPTTP